MGDGDLTAALPGTAATVVEDRGAAWGGIAVSTVAVTAGEGAAAPVFSVETAVCEGLRPPWAKPEVTATPANAIPKTQPNDVRVFIYPHELLMVFNCRASAHNIRRPALPLYSAQRRSNVPGRRLGHADRSGHESSHFAGRKYEFSGARTFLSAASPECRHGWDLLPVSAKHVAADRNVNACQLSKWKSGRIAQIVASMPSNDPT